MHFAFSDHPASVHHQDPKRKLQDEKNKLLDMHRPCLSTESLQARTEMILQYEKLERQA